MMLGPSSSKIIFEPTSAVSVETCSSRNPPMSKSAWVLPVALRSAPFSTSTRLWSAVVVYSIDCAGLDAGDRRDAVGDC